MRPPALLAIVLVLAASCGGGESSPQSTSSPAQSKASSSVEEQIVTLIEEGCIFHVTEGVGIDDCYVGFERVSVSACKERDPNDGGGKWDCIAEDLVTGERMQIRVIDAFDDLDEPDSAATAVNADDL